MGFLRKRGKSWLIGYTDEHGKRIQRTISTDKRVAEQALAKEEILVDRIKAGLATREQITQSIGSKRAIAEVLAEWRASLLDKGSEEKHVLLVEARAKRVLELCSCARLVDLAPHSIQPALSQLLKSGKSARTVNHYRAALRNFLNWCEGRGFLAKNPIPNTNAFRVVDERKRRALTLEECEQLIRSTESSSVVRETLYPSTRAWVYRIALATGLRRNELRSLTPDSFASEGGRLWIRLNASAAKNRKAAMVPLPLYIEEGLRAWLAPLPSVRPVFPLSRRTSEMIRADLIAAGIPFESPEGQADFHSLRSTFCSQLISNGENPKVVQELMRHSDPRLTLGIYAKLGRTDLAQAADRLAPAVVTQAPVGSVSNLLECSETRCPPINEESPQNAGLAEEEGFEPSIPKIDIPVFETTSNRLETLEKPTGSAPAPAILQRPWKEIVSIFEGLPESDRVRLLAFAQELADS